MWTLRCFITCVHRCSLSWVELSLTAVIAADAVFLRTISVWLPWWFATPTQQQQQTTRLEETQWESRVMSAANQFVESKIRQRKVLMFTKSRDPSCQLALRTLERYSMTRDVFEICEIDRRHDCSLIENHFLVICLASRRCVSHLMTRPICSALNTVIMCQNRAWFINTIRA